MLSLLFLLILSVSTFAQQATLKGTITDGEMGGEPLFGATISVDNGAKGMASDFDGKYSLEVEPGEHEVKFSYIGYEDIVRKVNLEPGQTLELNMELSESVNIITQVVVTGSKTEKTIGESIGSISKIDAKLIDNSHTPTVDVVLEKVPGVSILDGQANIRGGSGYSYGAGSRVLLLVDDLPLLNGDSGFPNWRDVPVENIGSVEVLKGAASALYGSSALNGIINIRTAYPTSEPLTKIAIFGTGYGSPKDADKKWWGQDQVIINAGDTLSPKLLGDNPRVNKPLQFGANFAHRQKFGKFDLVTGLSYFHDDGFRINDYDRKGRLNVNTRYRLTDSLSIGFNSNVNIGNSSSFLLWNRGDSTAYYPFPNSASETKIRRFNVDPFLTLFDKSGNRHKVMTRYFYVNNINTNGNDQSNQSSLVYGEYQIQRNIKVLDSLQMVAGVVGTRTDVNADLYEGGQFKASNVGAYLQVDKKFFDKLSIAAGARYELNIQNNPDSVTSPQGVIFLDPVVQESRPVFRVGANYELVDSITYLRASWGQGYRYPTIAERYISTNIGGLIEILPNPTLESETGWSAEIGARQGLKISNWLGFIDVAGFWTEYQNMMEFTFGGADTSNQFLGFQSVNIGNTVIRGTEVSIAGTGNIGRFPTSLLMGYTFIDPKFKEFTDWEDQLSSVDYNILKYRFQHSFKFDAETNFRDLSNRDRISVGLSLQVNSNMEAIDAFFEEFLNDSLWGVGKYRADNAGPTLLIDARVAYNITKDIRLSLVGKNLLNKEYSVRPGLLESPVNFTVRLDYKIQ